ncbi:MAG: two-component system response regulator MtrA [Ilumatobacter sp.]|jgi:two-component system response regulator MtrA
MCIASEPAGGALRSKILVVEDDNDICELIKFKLTSMGHDVIVENDGAAGFAAALAEAPDLVILDWNMPRLTGLEVCVSLRSDPVLSCVPVILITAKAEEADVEGGLGAGADDYVIKPFSPANSRAGSMLC